jgi:hypothetical protein
VQNVEENERDGQVVLAAGVNLLKWRNSVMSNTNKSVRFEPIIQDSVRAEAIYNSTTCDIVIVKVIGQAHYQAIAELADRLGAIQYYTLTAFFWLAEFFSGSWRKETLQLERGACVNQM